MDSLKSERHESIRIGKKMLTEQLNALGYSLSDKIINRLMEGYEIFETKPDELYFRIGIGLIKLNTLNEILKKSSEKKQSSWLNWLKPKEEKKNEDFVISDDGVTNHKYVIASCCNPIPGDSVIGFKASDGTVTVHKRTCETANNLASKFGDKIVTVKWDMDSNSGSSYLARISLKGTDRMGMINDITRLTSKDLNVNIRRFNLGAEDGIFDGFIDLYVHDIDDLENLIMKLKNIKGIESVARTEL
jgi:GTP pyrophosphokinase